MKFIQAALRFYPNQKNPARASGKGVYRVVDCRPVARMIPWYVWRGNPNILHIMAPRMFKTGSRVDPTKMTLGLAAA